MKYSYSVLFILALSGCGQYNPCLPETEIPVSWKEASQEIVIYPEKNRFWELFNDPVLNEIENEAIASNDDLKIAAYRLLEARSHLMTAHANRLPEVGLGVSFYDDETLLNPPSFGSPLRHVRRVEQQEYSLVADFSYELDFWGKLKALQDAANYRVDASCWAYEFVYQELVTDVAIHYFTLRTLEEEIRFLDHAILVRRDAVEINQCRVDCGLDPEIDLSRSKLELALAESEIEQAKRNYAMQEHALATLLGKPASCWSLSPGSLPQAIPCIPTVLPSEVLLRRADVQEKWALVAAGRSDVESAIRNYFPSFSLTTAGGLASPFLANLFQWQARYWQYALTALEPLFDGGKRDALVLQSKAVFLQNFTSYKKSVNLAFKDVEDALAGVHYYNLQYEAQARALDAAYDTSYLAKDQFDTGLISYLLVADADKTALDVERRAIALKGEKILAWIRLIKALGIQRDEDCF